MKVTELTSECLCCSSSPRNWAISRSWHCCNACNSCSCSEANLQQNKSSLGDTRYFSLTEHCKLKQSAEVCVCVCVCEREREREREKFNAIITLLHFSLDYDTDTQWYPEVHSKLHFTALAFRLQCSKFLDQPTYESKKASNIQFLLGYKTLLCTQLTVIYWNLQLMHELDSHFKIINPDPSIWVTMVTGITQWRVLILIMRVGNKWGWSLIIQFIMCVSFSCKMNNRYIGKQSYNIHSIFSYLLGISR